MATKSGLNPGTPTGASRHRARPTATPRYAADQRILREFLNRVSEVHSTS
jgi:hypothetical protein